MDKDFLAYSRGAELVAEYCEEVADQLAVNLRKSPYWVTAVSAAVSSNETFDLIVDAEASSGKIRLTKQQLTEYPHTNKDVINKIIVAAVKKLQSCLHNP